MNTEKDNLAFACFDKLINYPYDIDVIDCVTQYWYTYDPILPYVINEWINLCKLAYERVYGPLPKRKLYNSIESIKSYLIECDIHFLKILYELSSTKLDMELLSTLHRLKNRDKVTIEEVKKILDLYTLGG